MDYTYIVVTRYGGAGDLLMSEPSLEALYYKYAPARIILRTHKDYAWVLNDHPLIWKQIFDDVTFSNYGIKEFGWVKSDLKGLLPTTQRILHINLHGVIETMDGLHGVDAFAMLANVKPLRRTPSFGHFNFNNYHDIVVQLRSNDEGRGLQRKDLPLDLLISAGATFVEPESLTNEDWKDIVAGADLFIGPDSSGIHMAVAAGVRRIVGVYSPKYPATLRSYPGVLAAKNIEELNWMIESAMMMPKYPDYLNRGNAMEGIINKALQHCQGRGIDVGSSIWPLPGAVAVPDENHRHVFDQGPFDFLFSSHCLEHIKNWEEELKLWANSVKVGGTAFLYLPHPRMEMWKARTGLWAGAVHFWNPSPMELVNWLHENTTLRVEEYSAYPDAYWSFYLVAKKVKGEV